MRIQGGDHAALAELYDRHCRAAYTVALVLGGDRSTAAALVHDTFLAVWTGEARVPGERRARDWLLTVLRDKARQRGQDGECRRGALRDELLRQPVNAQGLDAETHTAVTQAIAALEADEVEVLVLAQRCGLQTDQIADLVGLPQPRIVTLLNHGLRALTSASVTSQAQPVDLR